MNCNTGYMNMLQYSTEERVSHDNELGYITQVSLVVTTVYTQLKISETFIITTA